MQVVMQRFCRESQACFQHEKKIVNFEKTTSNYLGYEKKIKTTEIA